MPIPAVMARGRPADEPAAIRSTCGARAARQCFIAVVHAAKSADLAPPRRGTHSAEAGCVVLSVCSNRSVDVVIVDTARAAGVALGASRTGAESTYVLCRHVDEATLDFTSRVLRRIERIQRTRPLGSLSYVGGTEAAQGRSPVPLLQALLPRLESGGCLTVLGPRHHQAAVFEWIEALLDRQPSNVAVRAELYTDAGSDDRAPRDGKARTTRSLPGAPASHRSSSALARLALDGTPALGGDHGARTV